MKNSETDDWPVVPSTEAEFPRCTTTESQEPWQPYQRRRRTSMHMSILRIPSLQWHSPWCS